MMNFSLDAKTEVEPDFGAMLTALSRVENTTTSTEGLKEIWDATKEKVLLMFNNHGAMIEFLMRNQTNWGNLDEEKYVRTVLVKDMDMVMDAFAKLNEMLKKTNEGKPVNLSELSSGDRLSKVGIILKEDGKLYDDKFRHGDWGEGRGKTNLSQPMKFKKKISDFGWASAGPRIASEFISLVKVVNKNAMTTSIDNHYRDLARVVISKHERADLKTDKRVALNQIRNILAIRHDVIKFVFSTLKQVIEKVEDVTKDPSKSNYDNGGTGGYY